MCRQLLLSCVLLSLMVHLSLAQSSEEPDPPAKTAGIAPTELTEKSLFVGKTLDDWGWSITNFGGENEVHVVDDQIVMEAGFPMTGIHRSRDEDLPTTNYEISLEAKRMEGIDFFCALTFPVHESHCTFVVAGWAGATVGLSCIDDQDASSNETTKLMKFEDNQWYQLRVRVDDESITCWIDEEQVILQKLEGHKISVRGDIVASRPLGLAAFESKVAYRKIRLSEFDPKDSDATHQLVK